MKNPSPYLKMRVLGAIDYSKGASIRDRIKEVAAMTFTDEEGLPCRFTWRTISTWYYRYKNYGITGVNKNDRIDKGMTRKLTPEELLEAINQALPHFREKHYNKLDIYRYCIERGFLSKQSIAQTTFYRFIREYELLDENFDHTNKKRLAFAMQYANQLWQADTMFGPHTKNSAGNMTQTKLIAFLDDASRIICHGQFFFNETIDSLVTALKAAFYKRGLPEQLYVDNGSIYCSKEITLICARIGCILRHAPLRDGAAKGKIERFFRTVRDQFLSRNLDLSSLETLNKQFTLWVEDEYNACPHSSLGMKPVDRFALDIKRVRFLPPNKAIDELFYTEESREVTKDNTFSFKGSRFEAPADLRGKGISIRFDRENPSTIIVYFKNNRIGQAYPLDRIANGLLRRPDKEASHD